MVSIMDLGESIILKLLLSVLNVVIMVMVKRILIILLSK